MPEKGKKTMRERILLIDDSVLVRRLYRNKLSLHSYQVELAVDGGSGLAEMARLHPDLVLLDLGLPDIDGLEVLERIKQDPMLKETPVIVLSGRESEDAVSQALEGGATGFLSKLTTRPQEVVDRVEKALAGSKRERARYRLGIDPISMDAGALAEALGRKTLTCERCNELLAVEVCVEVGEGIESAELRGRLLCPTCEHRKVAGI